jgi:predicted nucleotidyltransferase
MNNFQKILDSFSIKDTLNPKIWENPKEPNKAVMIPKVRKALMRISEEFIDYLGEDVFVDDIHLTGSLANFNWSEFSDFDLHVIVDLKQYEKQSDLYKELFNLKKQVFNDKHNIKIFGYDVELYAQDAEEPHYSSGVYSVMNDEWVSKPKKFKNEIDKGILEKKIKSWTEKIDTAIDEGKDLETIKTKLKDYRKAGLEKDGELSYENLVFKFLRRSGHIEKLFDTVNKETDKELSIERTIQE